MAGASESCRMRNGDADHTARTFSLIADRNDSGTFFELCPILHCIHVATPEDYCTKFPRVAFAITILIECGFEIAKPEEANYGREARRGTWARRTEASIPQ